MRVKCAVCHKAVEVVEEQRTEVICPSCGASIPLDRASVDAGIDHEAATHPQGAVAGGAPAPSQVTPLDRSPPARRGED